jgi:hypothetical protein
MVQKCQYLYRIIIELISTLIIQYSFCLHFHCRNYACDLCYSNIKSIHGANTHFKFGLVGITIVMCVLIEEDKKGRLLIWNVYICAWLIRYTRELIKRESFTVTRRRNIIDNIIISAQSNFN